MKFLLILFLFFTAPLTGFAQDSVNYAARWQQVYQYEVKDLPKSAQQVVDSIYAQSKQEENVLQQIRSMLYLAKFRNILEEEAETGILENFRQELSGSSGIQRAVLASLMGECYQEYLSRNNWKISRRTNLEEGEEDADFRTWTKDQFQRTIDSLYQLSLSDTLLLQQTSLDEIEEILYNRFDQRHLRPTVYDLLAHRAIDWYASQVEENSFRVPEFLLINPAYRDSSLTAYTKRTLNLYSSLMHLRQADTSALVNLWIERTHFLSQKGFSPDLFEFRRSLYDSLFTQYAEHPAGTLLQFEMANDMFEDGNQYSPDRPELKYAWREAKQIAEEAIAAFPDSFGAEKCRALIAKITRPFLNAEIETYSPVSWHIPVLISFANTDSARFSIRRLPVASMQNQYRNRLDSILSFKELTSFTLPLPATDDYREHSTEVALPKLPSGTYGLVITADNGQELFTAFQVTNLVLDVVEAGPDIRFRALDRLTGLPVKDAQIRISFPDPKHSPVILRGAGTIRHDDGQYYAMTMHQGDTSVLGLHNYYYHGNSNNSEERTGRIVAFTDRSIYRPGQTLYFKAILVQEFLGKSSVVPGEYIHVYLEDPNGEEVANLRLKTNTFGSVSGEIRLPADRITGEYSLYADEDDEEESEFYNDLDDLDLAEQSVWMEEYKRPTFEVTFDPVTEAIAIGDSITVSGQAKSFTGTGLSYATVDVKVEKSSRELYSYSYSRENILVKQIQTDVEGRFTISFRSVPDIRPRYTFPVQEYYIIADVHDVTGEVRSAEINARAALHAVEFTLNIPEELTAGDTLKAEISSENVNEAPAASAGMLEIVRLQTPDKPYRQRKWIIPDMPIYDETTYRELFPDRVYKNELDKSAWQRLEVAKSIPFSVDGKEELTLANDLAPGNYLIRTRVDSTFRASPVSDTYLRVKAQENEIPEYEVFSINIPAAIDTSAVTMQLNSGVDSLFVVLDLVNEDKILSSRQILLARGVQEVHFENLPVVPQLTIRYSYIWRNQYDAGSRQILRTETRDNLKFEVLTFRDKIDPAAQEEWRFRITGEDEERVTAEVLASMYDTSLDQFVGHEWRRPVSPHYAYNFTTSSLMNNFEAHNLLRGRYRGTYTSIPTREFDELNRFGFSLVNQHYTNNLYLLRLKEFLFQLDTLSEVSRGFKADIQKGYVTGTVKNRAGEAMPGVNIVVKGTAKGVITDINGYFSVRASPEQEIIFSFVGYSSLNVIPGENNSFDIILAEDLTHLSEVVVTGYGLEKKQNLTGSIQYVELAYEGSIEEEIEMDLDIAFQGRAAGVEVRGMNSLHDAGVLLVVDGVIMEANGQMPTDIANYEILKDAAATALYGARAANGVVIITTMAEQKRLDEQLAAITSRSDLRETAFFLPHLTTDSNGEVSFSFTSPENLTRWKLQLLAHDKSFRWGLKTMQTITRKELMVVPHLPRFLREGDEMTITAKVVNLSGEPAAGRAMISLKDAITGASLDSLLLTTDANLSFTAGPKAQASLSWKLTIPDGLSAVEVEVKAATDSQSDGERHVLPVLPNRTLVTESISLYSKKGQKNTFELPGLKKNNSVTLAHQSLRLSVDTNPVWTALQSLPYLMEFPYECTEQTFARLYANRLGSFLLTHSPELRKQLAYWQENAPAVSPLEKNQEVVGMMLQETPWWRDAQDESQAGERLARLMQTDSLEKASSALLEKLTGMQNSDGGMPWFAGGWSNQFITQHIGTGLIRLISLTGDEQLAAKSQPLLDKMKSFLDRELQEDYREKSELQDVHYQYFYLSALMNTNDSSSDEFKEAFDHYYEKMKVSWQAESLMLKSLAALSFHAHGDTSLANEVLSSIREYSLRDEEMGMFWKSDEPAWSWRQAPVESHVMAMHAFDQLLPDDAKKQEVMEDLKVWLLRQKQTQHWPGTKATTEAVHALVSLGADWVNEDPQITVRIGTGQELAPSLAGEYVQIWTPEEISPELATVTVEQQGAGASWGSLRWQYFEEYDKIRQSGKSLQVEKQLYRVVRSTDGEKLEKVGADEPLNNGDLVRVRLILRSDRTLEFIHLKDQRAAGFEPVDVLSGYSYQEGLRYYQSTRDAATHFFFDHAEQGVYVFEYDLRATHAGSYASGIARMDNMYSPAFSANSESVRVIIK